MFACALQRAPPVDAARSLEPQRCNGGAAWRGQAEPHQGNLHARRSVRATDLCAAERAATLARLSGSRARVWLSLAWWQPWLVLREALWQVALGVAIGIPLVLAATRLMASLRFGVPATDPVTLALTGLGDVGGGWCGELLSGAAGDEGGSDGRFEM